MASQSTLPSVTKASGHLTEHQSGGDGRVLEEEVLN